MPYLFSANGALFKSAWGNAPRSDHIDNEALNARFNESRFQRFRFRIYRTLGRCPRLAMEGAPLALNRRLQKISRCRYRSYNRHPREWNADGRGCPIRTLADLSVQA